MTNHIVTAVIQATEKNNRSYQLRKIAKHLPVRTILTAPSGMTYWYDVTEIEFDETAIDETTGEAGVFFCSGIQHFVNSRGEAATMTRNVPSYVLNS